MHVPALRIELPGALYHVTFQGDRREDIFVDDADRARLLAVVAQGLQRFDAVMLSYCLMGNHYHVVVRTQQANLSLLMRHINGVYSPAYNRRHGKVGGVPEAVQGHPGGRRRLPAGGVLLRGAEPRAGRPAVGPAVTPAAAATAN